LRRRSSTEGSWGAARHWAETVVLHVSVCRRQTNQHIQSRDVIWTCMSGMLWSGCMEARWTGGCTEGVRWIGYERCWAWRLSCFSGFLGQTLWHGLKAENYIELIRLLSQMRNCREPGADSVSLLIGLKACGKSGYLKIGCMGGRSSILW
jgi:hypothetical protein